MSKGDPIRNVPTKNSDLAQQTIKKERAEAVDSILSRGVRYRDSRVRAGELIYCVEFIERLLVIVNRNYIFRNLMMPHNEGF